MNKKRFDERDEELFPDRRFKGILYEPKKSHVSEEELSVRSRRNKTTDRSKPRRERKHGRLSASEAAARQKERKLFTRSASPEGRRVADRSHFLFGEHFFRNTVIACVVVAVVSSIAIPTSFAKPTVDIKLNIGGRVMEAPTAADTVGEFLEDNQVTVGPDDLLEVSTDAPITEGMEIILRRAMPVTIHSQGEAYEISMVSGTVQEALDKAGVVPAEHDEIYPSPDTYIRSGMTVEHIAVETKTREEYYDIPYNQTEKEDTTLAKGSTKITQYGENGERKLVIEEIWKNGVKTSEEVVSEEVTKEPITEITAVGTYVPPPEPKKVKISSIKNGGSSKSGGSGGSNTPRPDPGDAPSEGESRTMRVTAYCSACNSGSKTATGGYPSYGTIAAKTSDFPYGTKLWVEGYGYGVVEDTGGFPSGTIDVYLGERSSCNCGSEWSTGNRTVKVVG